MPDKKPNLDAAYALETPQDNRDLYADWASTYDAGFAAEMDYRLPHLVALIFAEQSDGRGPVLDVGAGTGLLVENLPTRAIYEIDALDISPDMLRVAMDKRLYRKAIEADLTQNLPVPDAIYGAIVSSGTFTHGHVGPDALDELLRIARKGALFVLAINSEHFEARGFTAKFAILEPLLTEFERREVTIYGPGADDGHKDDTASIAIFRKA